MSQQLSQRLLCSISLSKTEIYIFYQCASLKIVIFLYKLLKKEFQIANHQHSFFSLDGK